jgi:flagellar basal-body rod protein FlgG
VISRGIDIAAKGMMSLIDFQDSTANNIANVNTVGYKKEGLSFRNVYNAIVEEPIERNNPKNQDGRLVGEISMGSVTHKLVHEFTQGTLSRTDNPLDLGIEGDGMFKLRAADGTITYTRNGSFCINSAHFLTDMQGNQVLDDQNRPIRINISELNIKSERDLTINGDGTIVANRAENAQALQKIGIFDFANKDELMAVGTSMYIPKDVTTNPELRAQKFVVQQGTVELSNASVINEMINSIKISRNYETLSSFVKEKSNQLSRAISLGRVNN